MALSSSRLSNIGEQVDCMMNIIVSGIVSSSDPEAKNLQRKRGLGS